MMQQTMNKMLKVSMYTVVLALFGCTAATAQTNLVTIAGNGNPGCHGNGVVARQAEIECPSAAVTDREGNIYISDFCNNIIRKITLSGTITTIAGTGNGGYNGDNIPAKDAHLSGPKGLAVDSDGNLYFADSYNNRVRKISPDGIISTVAGNGSGGFSGDGGPAIAAQLHAPWGIAIDVRGNVYFSDRENNCIRKVDARGTISNYAGNTHFAGMGKGAFSGDGGPAVKANLYNPQGIAIDANGNLFIADCSNQRIRKVSTGGIMTTIAGNGTQGDSGELSNATHAMLNYPVGVTVSSNGNVYVCDRGNNKIKKVSGGVISTVTMGAKGASGTELLSSSIAQPNFVSIDNGGDLLVGDNGNYRIVRLEFKSIDLISTNVQQNAKPQNVPGHFTNN